VWPPARPSRLAPAGLALLFVLAPAPARAEGPLGQHGCTACHSLDGSARQGPTFAGLLGSTRAVERAGARFELVADEAYLARAIRDPDAEVVAGYRAGFMPRLALSDAEVAELVAAIAAVPAGAAPAPGGWGMLGLGLLLFVGGHLALSSAPLRRPLVARLGAGGFEGVYSLVAMVGLGLLAGGYAEAPYVALFDPPRALRWVPNAVMPVALALMVFGYTTPAPTVARMQRTAAAGPRGVHRITRHPALWGSALWGLAHVPPNGDLGSTLLFLGIAALSLVGMVHIDRRRFARHDPDWEAYARQTSVVPFAAILAGRQRLVVRELLTWQLALSVLAWGAMLAGHTWMIGVSPMP
jgi:uncharacterized membrane protein